jgi:hypothetical protein
MLSHAKRVMAKEKFMLMKMALDNSTNQQIMLNYEHICDLHILFKLAYILLLLEFVHVLIKFEQSRDVFVCDLMATIKVCQSYVYNMYYD